MMERLLRYPWTSLSPAIQDYRELMVRFSPLSPTSVTPLKLCPFSARANLCSLQQPATSSNSSLTSRMKRSKRSRAKRAGRLIAPRKTWGPVTQLRVLRSLSLSKYPTAVAGVPWVCVYQDSFNVRWSYRQGWLSSLAANHMMPDITVPHPDFDYMWQAMMPPLPPPPPPPTPPTL